MIISGNLLSAAHEQFKIKAGEVKRNWMDETEEKHAYRCFPLALTNQLGWSISFPEDITFMWDGIISTFPSRDSI